MLYTVKYPTSSVYIYSTSHKGCVHILYKESIHILYRGCVYVATASTPGALSTLLDAPTPGSAWVNYQHLERFSATLKLAQQEERLVWTNSC